MIKNYIVESLFLILIVENFAFLQFFFPLHLLIQCKRVGTGNLVLILKKLTMIKEISLPTHALNHNKHSRSRTWTDFLQKK